MAEPEPDLDTATVTAVAMGEESGRSASRDRDSGNLAAARVRLYLELRPGTWIIVLAERRGQTVFSHQLLAPVVHTDEKGGHSTNIMMFRKLLISYFILSFSAQ